MGLPVSLIRRVPPKRASKIVAGAIQARTTSPGPRRSTRSLGNVALARTDTTEAHPPRFLKFVIACSRLAALRCRQRAKVFHRSRFSFTGSYPAVAWSRRSSSRDFFLPSARGRVWDSAARFFMQGSFRGRRQYKMSCRQLGQAAVAPSHDHERALPDASRRPTCRSSSMSVTNRCSKLIQAPA